MQKTMTLNTLLSPISLPIETLQPKPSSTSKEYFQQYYKKNKQQMNRKRLNNYYLSRYTPEQLQCLQEIKPKKHIPQQLSCRK